MNLEEAVDDAMQLLFTDHQHPCASGPRQLMDAQIELLASFIREGYAIAEQVTRRLQGAR